MSFVGRSDVAALCLLSDVYGSLRVLNVMETVAGDRGSQLVVDSADAGAAAVLVVAALPVRLFSYSPVLAEQG